MRAPAGTSWPRSAPSHSPVPATAYPPSAFTLSGTGHVRVPARAVTSSQSSRRSVLPVGILCPVRWLFTAIEKVSASPGRARSGTFSNATPMAPSTCERA